MTKKVKVETPVEPIPREAIRTVEDICKALDKTRRALKYKLAHNMRERAILDRALYRTQTTLIDLATINDIAREVDTGPELEKSENLMVKEFDMDSY
jgi:hypothetical protein